MMPRTAPPAGARPAPKQQVVWKPASQVDGAAVGKMIKGLRNARSYCYYDTRLIGATAFQGETTAFNFASWQQSLPMFTHIAGQNGFAVTSMSDAGKMDMDFLCRSIAVDVFCLSDILQSVVGTTPVATGAAFVEAVVNFCALKISFNNDTEYVVPVSDLPAGGGVVEDAKVRTQTAAADSNVSHATNGLQTRQAVKDLPEPILFKMGQPFTITIETAATSTGANGPLNFIQGLTATDTANNKFFAGVRVKLNGVRGKPLLIATPVG